jgi:signal transduction histidine kinase
VVSQKLFSLMLGTEVIAAQLTKDPAAARREAERVKTLAREALDELRSLILGLRPPELERDGLDGALRKELELLGRVHPITFELVSESDGEIDAASAFVIVRIVHEALQNAVRHARANAITVRLTNAAVEVIDDGVGFDPDCADVRSRHLGLTSMEERARELGGQLAITSSASDGTTVRLELPPRP